MAMRPLMRDGAEIARVAIAADPDRRSFGERAGPFVLFKPFVKLYGATAHISMSGAGHFERLLDT